MTSNEYRCKQCKAVLFNDWLTCDDGEFCNHDCAHKWKKRPVSDKPDTSPRKFMHLASKQQCIAAAKMADDITQAIEEHSETVPLALAVGVLEIVKKELLESQ